MSTKAHFTAEVTLPAKLGRPRIHPDRKVYKADHERKRRAKAKS